MNQKIAAAAGMPRDMQRFKELFLVSSRALYYDFFSNQLAYHMGVAMALYAYTYYFRKFVVEKPPSLPFW